MDVVSRRIRSDSLPRLRAGTSVSSNGSSLPKNLFGEKVGETEHYGVQARPRDMRWLEGWIKITHIEITDSLKN
jgi:hypothetical protein